MDFRRLIFLVCIILMQSACVNKGTKITKEELYFKNFAISICIASSYKYEEIKKDGSESANGYREMGRMGLDAYEELRTLVDNWRNKDYSSLEGVQVKMPKCIDLYNSSELNALYKKYTPCENPDSWLSQKRYINNCK